MVPPVICKSISLAACSLMTAEELPAKTLFVDHGKKSSQTSLFSYYFLSVADTHNKAKIKNYMKKIIRKGQVEGGQERYGRGGHGGVLVPGRGHSVPVERNSGKHPSFSPHDSL